MEKLKNNIEESCCSYELSKLLRVHGFNCLCDTHWEWGNGDKKQNISPGIFIAGFVNSVGEKIPYSNSQLMDTYIDEDGDVFGEFSRPTLGLAMEWVEKNFGYHIETTPRSWESDVIKWSVWINNIKKHNFLLSCGDENRQDDPYDTKEEAIEVAITYILKKNKTNL
jgi:hypothetical protein